MAVNNIFGGDTTSFSTTDKLLDRYELALGTYEPATTLRLNNIGENPIEVTCQIDEIQDVNLFIDNIFLSKTNVSGSTTKKNFTFTIPIGQSTLKILGGSFDFVNGQFLGQNNSLITDISLNSNCRYVGNSDTGDGVFYNCTGITSLKIPNTLTRIGKEAFKNCSNIETIIIESRTESNIDILTDAFLDCTNIQNVYYTGDMNTWSTRFNFSSYTSNPIYSSTHFYINNQLIQNVLTIPVDIQEIQQFCFTHQPLRSINIPSSNNLVNLSGFDNCTELTSINTTNLNNNSIAIKDYAFDGCIKLQNSSINNLLDKGKSIGKYAFRGCTYATSISHTYGVGEVAESAFEGCTNLTTCFLRCTASIQPNVFKDCTKLTSATLQVQGLCRSNIFVNCTSLTSLKIFNAYEIAQYVISSSGSTSLTSLEMSSVQYINSNAFYNCTALTTANIFGLKNNGVIASQTFSGCTALTNLYISCAGAAQIGPQICGSSNSSLTTLSIEGGSTISGSAFYSCTALKTITIANAAQIYEGAFAKCSSVETLTIPYVGEQYKSSSSTYQFPFGYIFGTSSYTGGVQITQSFYGSSLSSTTSTKYYIPGTLATVTILGGNLLYGAFSGCTSTFTINLPSNLTAIEAHAFYGATGLQQITIPASVTRIGDNAFANTLGAMNLSEITFMHTASNPLTLPASGSSTGIFRVKTARNMTINYYGNSTVANYNYSADNITATLSLQS